MIYIIKPSSEKSPDSGSFYDEPNGLEEISQREFAQGEFFVYTPVEMEFRQVHTKTESYDLRIFWMHIEKGKAHGVAIRNDYWGGKIRYYRVGCNHKFKELSAKEAEEKGQHHFGRCYHVIECIHCGYIRAYDSSD